MTQVKQMWYAVLEAVREARMALAAPSYQECEHRETASYRECAALLTTIAYMKLENEHLKEVLGFYERMAGVYND